MPWHPDVDDPPPPPRWSVASVVLVRDADGELVAWQALAGEAVLVPPTDRPWLLAPAAPLAPAEVEAFVATAQQVAPPGLALPGQVMTAALVEALDRVESVVELALPRVTFTAGALAAWRGPLPFEQLDLRDAQVPAGGVATLVDACPRLRALTLTDTPLDDAAIAAIGAAPQLEALGASGTGLSDAQAAQLVDCSRAEIIALARTGAGALTAGVLGRWPRRELHLDDTPLDDGAAAQLASLAPTLERFTASRTRVGDRGLAWLPKATGLRQLELADTAISDALVRRLALPALQEIDLGGRPVTAATWLGLLAGAPDLTVAVLGPNRRVDDAVAAAALAHPGLTVLGLGDTSVTSAGLVGLAGTPMLRELDLHGTAVRALDALVGAVALETLSLRRTEITDLDVAPLATLRGLASVDVGETALTAPALRTLAALPALRALYADGTEVTAPVLAALGAAPALEVVVIDGALVDEAALAPLQARDLHELSLGATAVGDGVAALLPAWPRLRVLSLAGTRVTDAVLPAIIALPALHTLNLSATAVQAIAPLAGLPRLAVLGLARTPITDAALASLGTPAVHQVSLARTRLTAAAVATLATWPALREVDLTGVDLGKPRVAQRALAPLDARGVHVER